ncbi:hypothetical protein B0T22DRAFT_521689 [Podospora appendiculata]|uniref:Phytanoyl-CoA dioxygenase n=1 Tax=Podospora appendiculata TaxID=314037 RepID=A0AAE0X0Q2_9PEZI|nr:hypothetical protein B0T22DRAFT_521689 [Podospora appendiculata]
MTTPPPDTDTKPSLSAFLKKDGFIIIPSLLTPAELTALRAAASNITALARAGGWPHIRTVGKQFPPWPSPPPLPADGIWGVQHLLHPRLPISQADRLAFQRLYFSPSILAIASDLLACPLNNTGPGGTLVMELCNMLVRPDTGFALRWHRDDIPWSASASEEESRLAVGSGKPVYHTQWNLALYDDDSLVLVPGSHARARTPAERAADPYAEAMPAQRRVALRAGDVAFYDNNILHRGVYDANKERMTLHGSVGHVDGSRERARNVLQHGVGEWVAECDFGGLEEGVRATAEGMRERLVRMGRESGDVGFSLTE